MLRWVSAKSQKRGIRRKSALGLISRQAPGSQDQLPEQLAWIYQQIKVSVIQWGHAPSESEVLIREEFDAAGHLALSFAEGICLSGRPTGNSTKKLNSFQGGE